MTLTSSILHGIPGGDALVEWFGCVPRFHDAEMMEVAFSSKGSVLLRIYAWRITDEIGVGGYCVVDNHALVTLALEGVSAIGLGDFHDVLGTIGELEITRAGEHFRIVWASSEGVTGSITAKQVRINLKPGMPQ